MSALIMEGDDESIDTAFKKIRQRADTMYRADGGRDVAKDKHDRSFEQRLYDAAMDHLAGTPADKAASSASSGRPVMVFTGTLSDITSDPDQQLEWECELIGSGRLPMAVAEYYRCISDHAAQLVSDVGEVLWQGRTKRMVTRGQWLALVVRDGGCVLCGLDYAACEAHHLKPWNAPVKGETNIDQLALVCADCHHRIHDNRLTMYLDHTHHKWRLRAATPNEIAPDGRRPQPERAKTMDSRSRDPSGSRFAASRESVNAT